MNKGFLLAAALMAAAQTLEVAAEEMLVLRLRGGGEVSYVLAEKPVMTFSGGQMVVTSADGQAEYALGDVEEFRFADRPSAIADVKTNEVRFVRLPGGGARIYGVTGESDVMVFDAGGRAVPATVTPGSGYADIQLGRAAHGVYVIKAKGMATIKITIR